jgi:hypothetical protein
MNENFEVTKQLIIEMLNDKHYNSDMSNDMNFTINWISEIFKFNKKQISELKNLANLS